MLPVPGNNTASKDNNFFNFILYKSKYSYSMKTRYIYTYRVNEFKVIEPELYRELIYKT